MSTITGVLLDQTASYQKRDLAGFTMPFLKDWSVDARPGGCCRGGDRAQEGNLETDVEVITGRIAISL